MKTPHCIGKALLLVGAALIAISNFPWEAYAQEPTPRIGSGTILRIDSDHKQIIIGEAGAEQGSGFSYSPKVGIKDPGGASVDIEDIDDIAALKGVEVKYTAVSNPHAGDLFACKMLITELELSKQLPPRPKRGHGENDPYTSFENGIISDVREDGRIITFKEVRFGRLQEMINLPESLTKGKGFKPHDPAWHLTTGKHLSLTLKTTEKTNVTVSRPPVPSYQRFPGTVKDLAVGDVAEVLFYEADNGSLVASSIKADKKKKQEISRP